MPNEKLNPSPIKAAQMIHGERYRQQIQEGYTSEHDDEHEGGQLAVLAAGYAMSSRGLGNIVLTEIKDLLETYNWGLKPKDPIRDLTRAGALILAELERRLRAGEEEEVTYRFADLVQLPHWKSHKVVAADKIIKVWHNGTRWDLACGATIKISDELRNRVPQGVAAGGGYYVRYEDGFESWSPADAFEKGYRRLP